jgi:hypothetical protein
MPPIISILELLILIVANLRKHTGIFKSIKIMRRLSISYRSIRSKVPFSLL